MDNLNKFLVEIKNILYGNIDNLELDEEKVLEASKYIQSEGLILMLINNIDAVSFEARKDIALIFNNLIRKNVNNFAQYLADNIEIMQVLLLGYLSSDSALSCGSMLRESIRHENIARYILLSDSVWAFFDTYVHLPNFEVASDAFNTLRDLLTTPKHKHVAEEFMEAHCDKLLEKYDVWSLFF
jgi:calcium binding protein 39